MEDTEIAKGLISHIIGENIVQLDFRPREIQLKHRDVEGLVIHLDFKAVVKTKEGTHKTILIELQKAKYLKDILRFRKYLGVNYQTEEQVVMSGKSHKVVLPIIPIYFLGFKLKSVPTPLLRVNRVYTDLRTNTPLEVEADFVELLSHDTYVIQISRLAHPEKTGLERILRVFNQKYLTENKYMLKISEKEVEGDILLTRIVERLRRAATTSELLARLEIEDELDRLMFANIRAKLKAEEKSEEYKKLAEEQTRLAEVRAKKLQEAEEEKAAKDAENARLLAELEALKRKLKEGEDNNSD